MTSLKIKNPIILEFKDSYLDSLRIREIALKRRIGELQCELARASEELEIVKNNIIELVL